MSGERGFTYALVLVTLVLMGVGLASAGTVWKTVMQREREEELFFRGDQIKKAIESYYYSGHGGANFMPRKIDDLIKDVRFLTIKRHLRKAYADPMTKDGEWEIMRDDQGRIKGVRSKSELEPFRQKGFPLEYKEFENKKRYRDWEFVFNFKKKA